jgi:hypothetical protein
MLIVSHIFPSLVLSEGKEEDDMDYNAKDVAAAAGDDNKDDEVNGGTSMPPKMKPMAAAATKTVKKTPEKADEITHLWQR